MEVLDIILEALADGNVHDINELSTLKGLKNISMSNLMEALQFLAKYEFIELTRMVSGVVEAKIEPNTQAFLKQVRWTERSENRRLRT